MSQALVTSLKTRVRPHLACFAILTLAAAVVGCGGETGAERIDVVADVDLPTSVPVGQPLDIRYTWTPGAEFSPPADDYQVFVHFRDADGAILLQDDHYPPDPTSTWRAGETQEYRRWYYVPEDFATEDVTIVVGLYLDSGRAEIRSDNGWGSGAAVHEMQVRIDDVSGLPVWGDGWHPEEHVEGGERWRWSTDEARVLFTNPGTDSVLHLRAHGPYDEIGGPQTVVLSIGENELTTLEIDSAEVFLERIDVPAAMLGDTEWVELTFRADPTIVPNELDPTAGDSRRLGLQIFTLFLSSS